MTHQRIEIYRELQASHGHPSVAEVYEGVRDRLPSVSLDTVYRTLRLFSELGIINPHSSTGSGVRFDVNTGDHHHFVCTRCGRTIDFTSSSHTATTIPVEAEALGEVQGTQLEVRGICTQCIRTEQNEGKRDHER
jgi:Fur family peroxide stress response transcriptional regulator